MEVRLAASDDLQDLLDMRYEFTVEDYPDTASVSREEFSIAYEAFFSDMLKGEAWKVFVAVHDGRVVSHMYLQIIEKVPRPGRPHRHFAYVTNVYTRPAYRGQGIGAQVHQWMEKWAREQDLEMLIVWPSSGSVKFYGRNGFVRNAEMMELDLT
ncbi:hypothetical protein EL26_18430 [Tumebacillus flagellatus]|uniref:N-acetyltransferase domain-containing protein n=1 Tax=Tumebacillus flagellatus TaxID=1157490 RepID=A0A074LL40_9BACL|nr:hypothetical protein EL26_18430 [Tumebacillus flagellatus]